MISNRKTGDHPRRAQVCILGVFWLSGLAAGGTHGLAMGRALDGTTAPLPPTATQEGEADPQEQQTDASRALTNLAGGITDEQEAALRLVDEILQEQRVLLSGQNFVYQSGGRRDPFRSLLLLRQRELAVPTERPVGLAGFLVNEVTVKAVAQYQGRWHAMVVGLDGRSYFTAVGTQLYDGQIIEINEGEVIFEQEVEDMLGARSTRRLIKRLKTGT